MPEEDVETVALLEAFGHRIGNTDMHLGNVSLSAGAGAFRLLPAYDMCSMVLAPVRGEARPLDPSRIGTVGDPLGSGLPEASRDVAHALALDFWTRVRGDDRASGELAELAAYRQKNA